jgi:hypothetical protein
MSSLREKHRLSRLEMLECTNFLDLSAQTLLIIEDEDFYLDSSDATLSRNRAGAGVKPGIGLLALRGALRDRMFVASGLMDSTSSSSSSSTSANTDSSKKATRFLAGGTNAMVAQARKLRKVSEIVAVESFAEGEGLSQRDDIEMIQRATPTALFGWKSSDGVSGALSFLGSRENSKKYVDAAAGKSKRPARRFCGSCGRCNGVEGVILVTCTVCSTYTCSKSCIADHKNSGRCTGSKKN